MGGFDLSLIDRLYIAKTFFKKLFQVEILLLLILSFLIKFNYDKLKILKKIKFTMIFYFIFLM